MLGIPTLAEPRARYLATLCMYDVGRYHSTQFSLFWSRKAMRNKFACFWSCTFISLNTYQVIHQSRVTWMLLPHAVVYPAKGTMLGIRDGCRATYQKTGRCSKMTAAKSVRHSAIYPPPYLDSITIPQPATPEMIPPSGAWTLLTNGNLRWRVANNLS